MNNLNSNQITEIRLVPVMRDGGLTFFASCIIHNSFFIGNIALISRLDGSGFRCVYPNKVLSNGAQIPVFYPINNKVGKVIEETLSAEAIRLLDSNAKKLHGKYVFGSKQE